MHFWNSSWHIGSIDSNFPFWTLHKVSVSCPFITLPPALQQIAALTVLAQPHHPEAWLPTETRPMAEGKPKREGGCKNAVEAEPMRTGISLDKKI